MTRETPPALTLAAVLARQAQDRPHAVALEFMEQSLTYGALEQRSREVAGLLWHQWGVRRGDRVAWLGFNHAQQLVLLFALARIGAVLLPLNFRLAPAEWVTLLADCTPVHLVFDDDWATAAEALGTRCGLAVHPVQSLALATSELAAPESASAADPVLLVYTSGTTSRPRAAVHTQANLLANMAIASRVQAMTPQDTVLAVLPLFHVGGLCIQTLPALYVGARVLLHRRFDAQAVLASFTRDRPSLTLQVPATLKALVEHPDWSGCDLSGLRAVWAGSSLLPAPLIASFHARGVPVCNVYGATETGPFSIALAPEHALDRVGSCGWPAPGVEVRLEQPGPDGAGELLLRAPNVVQHYWPDVPACDGQGWFHTGDLARRAADGSYTVVGRASDLIISGGENIHPAEIEEALGSHAAVAECAAFGQHDPDWGEVVIAAVVLQPGRSATEAELQAHLAQRLARFKLPRRWLLLEALPRTALGKLQRHALAALVR